MSRPQPRPYKEVAPMLNISLRRCLWIDLSGCNLGRRVKWCAVAVGLTMSISQVKAEYRVNVGDVLEVAVAGVPELRSRAPVQIDGNISLPLVGMLQVAGLPLQQIRVKVGAALASKVFRMRTLDGRENAIVIDADEVTAAVADYRPLYVNGDVSKPGEYPYRPVTTARQLIAQAGGYDIMRIKMNNPFLESADLRNEYRSLWTEFAKEQTHIWRVKNELGDVSQIDPAAMKDAPIPFSTISEIVKAETEYLKTKQSDYQREKAFLQRGVREGDDQVNVLSAQQKTEEEGYQSDLEELQKVNDLYNKGSLVSPRVADARRAVQLSSTRKLQTQAQLMQLKTQQEELKRKLEKLDDQRRLELLRELGDESVKLSEIRGKLQTVGEKLQYTAMVRSQLAQGAGSKPDIAIIRKGERGPERIIADEDAELQPGDTVEVTLEYNDDPDAPLRKTSSANSGKDGTDAARQDLLQVDTK